ncbi:MAG: GNAT family N-acetyltransferase [Flavobacterium sp.]
MIEVIKADSTDFETINGLAKRTWGPTYKSILSEPQLEYMFDMMYSEAAYNEQIAIKNHHFLLVKDGKEFLGFASYELNYRYETTKVHKIYIVPEAQGKGAGKILMNRIIMLAKQHQNDKLILNVNRYNTAVNFYEGIGFVKLGEEDIDIGNGYLMEDYIMQLAL